MLPSPFPTLRPPRPSTAPPLAPTPARRPATPDPAEFQARYAWRCESPDGLVAADVPLLEFLNGVALDALVVNGEPRFERRIAPPETRLPLPAA